MGYVKNLKLMALVSGGVLLVGLIFSIIFGGLNMGIDFTGGTIMTLDMKGEFDLRVITRALSENNIAGAQAVRTGVSSSMQTQADIRMQTTGNGSEEADLRQSLLESIRRTYPTAEIIAVDSVDGIASIDLIRNALLSVAIASALMLVYIWFRFELLFGVAAVVALLHDVMIMLAFTSILRVPINSPFIAAVLTIIGYSINNTIVVFDRIREYGKSDANMAKHRAEIVDKSIKSTLGRSINTTLTTLLTISMVYLFGVESIREFALPIIIGLLAGAYSSIFLAGPMWASWHKKLQTSKNRR